MKKPLLLACLILFLVYEVGNAQEEKALAESELSSREGEATLNFGADLVSRYIWRGMDFGNSPAIQPAISFSWKGLSIGCWGSYAFAKHSIALNDSTVVDAGNYSEIDLYVSYTYKWFTLMFFDYFVVNGLNPNDGNRYFNFNNKTTGHTFELCFTFNGPEKFPVQFTASTLVYGDDKNKDTSGVYGMGNKNNYSTYFEIGYNLHFKKIDVDLKPFVGGIPFGSSWYSPYASITNVGINARKEIPVTQQYSLPVQVSLITNPQAQSLFLVFGISL